MSEPLEPTLVPHSEAANLDWERQERAAAYKAAIVDGFERVLAELGVQLLSYPRSALRFDDAHDPPRLDAGTLRFERWGYKRQRRKRL